METSKPIVFVITPFNEDFLALFEEFKQKFGTLYEFTNAGDLDNQQNILKDIVEGVATADVIIADLTGLNANVFYELGLAHAMGKKVIIITQDIDELPFDIKSYRANQYSLQFNKLPDLITELNKLLNGAIDGSIKYGNPVMDYAPNFKNPQIERTVGPVASTEKTADTVDETEDENDGGYLDYIADVNENGKMMVDELGLVCSEMTEMSRSITKATEDINKVKGKSGNVDPIFVRNVCRKLSEPVDSYAEKLKTHIEKITEYWNKIENSYLELLDNPFIRKTQNIEELKRSITALDKMQTAIDASNNQIENLIISAQGTVGIERRLTKAVKNLISVLQAYLTMTNTISSSGDRINSKSEIIISEISD
ncbi:MAG: nucleoside 2-deoxyribosyltransferase [Lachnospiraceae bacterium]|nr:nucleoside 2-deoxyribosyltransferase [Lachnospiraceae bacterium]